MKRKLSTLISWSGLLLLLTVSWLKLSAELPLWILKLVILERVAYVIASRKEISRLLSLDTLYYNYYIFPCHFLQLTKFTKMNVWTHVYYWPNRYPTGPDDPICPREIARLNQTAPIPQWWPVSVISMEIDVVYSAFFILLTVIHLI